LVGFGGRSTAQVLPIPLLTTTTAPSPRTTVAPTTTTTETPPTTEQPVDTSIPLDTIPLTVDTTPLAPPAAAVTTTAPARRAAAPTKTVALPSGIRAASVTGAFGLGVGGVLIVALVLITATTFMRLQLHPGGTYMNARRRARLLAGLACLAVAAIVGLVGYLKLSLEPDVNRQIPYMASAGMALVLLSAVGGALIVGEQMRTDEQRIEELETAVEQLAALVAPTVEAPPRTRAAAKKRGGR
jgi:hypothetical protein